MRINEILTESQLQQLDEGPIGSALGAVGRGVGKAVGGVAKGVGAVAGGAVGAFNALKKGFQTGKAVVGDDPDPNAGAPGYTAPTEPAARTANTAAAPTGGAAAPAAGGAAAPAGSTMAPTGGAEAPASSTTPPSAQEINAQGPAGTAPAKAQTGAAGQALAKSTAVVDKQQAQSQEKANQTVYAQVKANVDKLDKKGKQRILQLLQKSVAAPAPKAPAAAPGAAPAGGAAAPAAGGAAAADPGAGAMGQMANQLAGEKPNTMANAPVSKTNVAKPGNPNAAPAAAPAAAAPAADPAATKAKGGKVAGQVSQSPDAVRKREARAAAANKAKAGNSAMSGMANQLQQQNASKDNYGNALSEALAHRVEFHKQKMFETGLSRGSISVFRK